MEASTSESGPQPRAGNGARAQGAEGEAAPPAAKASGARRPLVILGILAALSGGAYAVHAVRTAGEETTDDAQVESDVIPLGARTGGLVLRVPVHENQTIAEGDLLLEIDSAEHTARVAQAEAELANGRAQEAASRADVDLVNATARGGLQTAHAAVSGALDAVRSAAAEIAVAEAGVTRARAQAAQTTINLTRARALRAENAVAQVELDNAQSLDDAAQAAVAQAVAQLTNARAMANQMRTQIGQAQGRLEQSAPVDTQLAAAHARLDLAHARVQSAEAALQLARLQLSYTRVVAPASGVISRLSVHPGQLIQAGQALAELVPSGTYVVANFKETQVGEMRAGNRAEIRIDAYPGRVFEGVVDSLSGGTGARFSLLPPDNASGNFVKVVQRVPVRVRWLQTPDVSSGIPLRAGLSADVTVNVRETVAVAPARASNP